MPHVVVLAGYLRFPHGMAATNRVRLLGRALVEAGVDVRVLCLQASERPPHVENTEVRGTCLGVDFEYAAGTTVRHESFLMRRVIEIRGWTRGAQRLVELRREGRLDAVYLWFTSQKLELRRVLYLTLLKMLHVPVIAELNERPWPLRDDLSAGERAFSPLTGVAGVVSISAALTSWARGEARRLGHALTVLEVPIVVDVDERMPADYPAGGGVVVFAGSPEYDETIRFVFAAMEEVWRARPDCTLVVTGAHSGDPASRWLAAEARRVGAGDRLKLAGYLRRGELLDLYAQSHALLIPLFDDVRSKARFPTKIGEYLAAARPVVTSAVGEIPNYFEHGVNGLVCEPGDTAGYGRAIVGLLDDPPVAARIGREGRRLAETRFHYALFSDTLRSGFAAAAGSETGA